MRKLYFVLALTIFHTVLQAQPQISTTTGTGSNAWPFAASATSTNNKVQWLYQSSDFSGGLPAGAITDIYFKSINPIISTTYTNLTFKIGTTTISAFTSGAFLATDTVFKRSTYRIDNMPAEGWIRIPLDVPFNYTGDNLVIEASHTGYTDPITVRHSNIATGNRRLYGNHLSATGTAVTGQMDVGLNITTIPCGTPISGGAVITSVTESCSWRQVMLTLQGHTPGTGQIYRWQTSPDNVNWTDANNPSPSDYFATTQGVTTYYRAQLKCGDATAITQGVPITTPAPVSGGSYTINAAQATGSGNFQSFADAVNHIACGISGPVVFNVLANSGPYTEQVSIPAIAGTTETNTITINGNGNTLQFAPPTGARHIFQLKGTDHVKVNDLIIKTTDNTFGWAVHLINQSDHVSFKRCILDVGSVNQSETNLGNSMALLTSASYTLVAQGNTANNLTVDSCTLIGGYQAIYMNGSAEQKNKHNKILNSTIRDFYSSGININNQDSAQLIYNDFSRPNRTTSGSILMIDVQPGNTNMLINSNKLHDTHTSSTAATGNATGIGITNCDAPAGSENIIVNNLLYRFNTAGTITGFNNNNSDGVIYYHNTVVLANTNSTGGLNPTRGLNQTGQAERIHVRNNLFYIARGGAGPKHCLYFNTPATTFTSNNNVLVNLSTTPANNGIAFLTSNYATLPLWQSSNNNAYDQESFDNDPAFTDTTAFNFTPTASALDNQGKGVGVQLDIYKAIRNTLQPDIGAIEWSMVLPVKLLNFSAVKSGVDASLTWSTATEEKLQHFVVERSVDGTTFVQAGTVNAGGNSTSLRFYSFVDAAVFVQPVVVYYRLKMMDADGMFTYSKIVRLQASGKHVTVSAFPNPVVKNAQVKVLTTQPGIARVTVRAMNGISTGVISRQISAGVNILWIPSTMMSSAGQYLVVVEVNGERHVLQLTKAN